MNLSKEIILEASQTDLVSYCNNNGFELIQKGQYFYLKEFDSCQINGNMWIRWSGKYARAGLYHQGNAVQFVREFENLSFQDAVTKLCEFRGLDIQGEFAKKISSGEDKKQSYSTESKKKDFNVDKEIDNISDRKEEFKLVQLPQKNDNNKRVIAYLTKTRKIHPEVVNHFIKNGTLYEDNRHNAVFIGYDEKGIASYAFKRSTNTVNEIYAQYRGEALGSKKKYNWCSKCLGDTVKVFESPLDALSAITLDRLNGINWRNINYLSLGCVAPVALETFLENNTNIKNIEFCLDNDTAGRKAINQLMDKYGEKYECKNSMPDINSGAKDYNELLSIKLDEVNFER